MSFWNNLAHHLPALALALPLLGAFAVPLVGALGGDKTRNRWIVSLSALITVVVFALLCRVLSQGTQIYVMGASGWNIALPSGLTIPVRIIIEVDAFNALVASVVALCSFSGTIYGVRFLEPFTGKNSYSALYLLLTAGTLGMILTGDLFNFFVFLEIASVASFGLIAFWRDRPEAVEASYKYMLISQLAAIFVLMALAFVYARYGVLNMAALSSVIAFENGGTVEKVILALLFVALGMKCGAFPMHMWMPEAYAEAPASVTVLLVATSQASLVVLCRVCFSVFGAMPNLQAVPWTLIILGCSSMFFGVSMAVVQHEVKRLMGYHSVSQIGYMLMAFGAGLLALSRGSVNDYGSQAVAGGIFHMINYMLYKGLLFLCAGALYRAAGTRNLDRLGGLARVMPVTSALFLIAAAAISGLPPLNGFTSKWLIYESVFAVHPMIMTVALVTSVLTLASFVKVYQTAFLGPGRSHLAHVREVPRSMLAGMGLLAVAILFLSLFPTWAMKTLICPAAEALLNKTAYGSAVMGGAL